MKKTFLALIAILIPLCISAQVDDATKKALDAYVMSKMSIDRTQLEPAILGKVFNGRFYEMNLGFASVDGSILSGSDYCLNIDNGKVTEVPSLSSDMELTTMFSLVKKDFLLKDEPSALTFEKSLDILFPPRDSDKANVKHMKKNNQWIFIRGKFFDDSTAVIVTVNPNGSISKIELKLSYQAS